jgi:hypothetical protein
MNSLKNLMIIGVLAAVGYGVYVSLQRNNVDSEQPFGTAKTDASSAKPLTSRGLPLSGSPILGDSGGLSAAPSLSAPPIAPPLVQTPAIASPASPSTTIAPTPLPSSASNAPLTPPSFSPSPTGAASTPGATLGAPESPEGLAMAPPAKSEPNVLGGTTGGVQNLPPPPGTTDTVTPGVTATAVAVPADAANTADSALQTQFNALMEAVRKRLEDGKFAEAQLALSTLYGDPNLSSDQLKQITDILDQLAGTVIYSRQHLLAPAYVVQSGDTIDTVAQKYSVPWQLLAKINGLMPPGTSNTDTRFKDQPLPPGKQLKVLQGPFDAVVHLDKRELTLMVQKRYAARFRIGIGRDQPKLEGEYTVRSKTLNPTYYGPDGANVPPGDPRNPLGGAWIELSDRVGIHGTPDPRSIGRDNNRGAISVGDQDLQDLYGILSVGSRVTIMR